MKEQVLIIGSGGHARSIIDILVQNAEYNIAGCVSNEYRREKYIQGFYNIPIIGNDEMLEELFLSGIKKVIVAVGDNNLRKTLFEKVIDVGYTPIRAISQFSYISSTAYIGVGSCIMAGACIGVDVKVGDDCIINTNASIDHDCVIGNHVHIAPGVSMSGTVSVGEKSFLGTGANVIDRVTIGSNVIVGAGGVVTDSIINNVTAVGVPARIIKKR